MVFRTVDLISANASVQRGIGVRNTNVVFVTLASERVFVNLFADATGKEVSSKCGIKLLDMFPFCISDNTRLGGHAGSMLFLSGHVPFKGLAVSYSIFKNDCFRITAF